MAGDREEIWLPVLPFFFFLISNKGTFLLPPLVQKGKDCPNTIYKCDWLGKTALWTGTIYLLACRNRWLCEMTSEGFSLSSLSHDSEVELGSENRSQCLLRADLYPQSHWESNGCACCWITLTCLFFLGHRDEESSSPAHHGEQMPSFYPAENLDNRLIDQRVLKQRWDWQLWNILKPNDNICLCFYEVSCVYMYF